MTTPDQTITPESGNGRRNRRSNANGTGFTATAEVAYQPYVNKDGTPNTDAHSALKYAQTGVGAFEVPLLAGAMYITTAMLVQAKAALGHDPLHATVTVIFR